MDALRIFISSPGDVAEERERARQVVQGLRRRYARHFALQPIFWEDMSLSVDAPFQVGIEQRLSPRDVDIAVFILWSRMGSPVGPRIRRADGGEYRSGTERELDLMLEARRAQGGNKPHILAYLRQDEVAFAEVLRSLSKPEQEESLRQKLLVEEFIREEFHDSDSGANVRAYHTFPQPQSFAQRLRVHLEEILDGLCADRPARPVWEIDEQGPPFRGLEAFRFEHAEIFFGREDEVAEARVRLGEAARRGTAFLLIGGASGTGKSSLAAAGLLPEIVAHETDETVGRWLHAEFTPAALGGDPAAGMACILLHAVPPLAERCGEADLAEALGRDPRAAVHDLILPALAAAAKPGSGSVRLVLLVDQLEELFSDPRLGDAGRDAFANILQALASSGGVWVVATLRGDRYPRLLGCPALVALKAAGAQLDLVPPGADAVRRMIESPAVLSGLAYERVGATSLADRILRDVADRAELLPVLEDLLRELFERRTAAGLLTHSAYEALGGIEGSLAKRAEASLASVPVDVQLALSEVLRRLVATGDGDDAAPIRRRAPLASFPPGSPARALVEKLVADRLATASARDDGAPEVAIAHEAILRVWPRAAAWIRENAEFLRVRDRLAARMREAAPLSASDPLLPAAKALLQAQRDALEPDLAAYVEGQLAAIDADRRRRERTRRRVVAGLSALAVAASVTAAAALWQWRDATRAKTAAETARDTAVTSRTSAEGLVEFMTFNLRDKLEPIGRLDLMEDVLEKLDTYHAERIRLEEAGREDVTLDDLRRREAFFTKLGELARDTGDLTAARKHLEKSLAIARHIAARDPADPERRRDLAANACALGVVASEAGDLDAAADHFHEMLRIAEALVAEDPRNERRRHDVAMSLRHLGDLSRVRGDLDVARRRLEESLAIMETLVAAHPGIPQWQRDTVTSLEGLALVAQEAGDLDETRAFYDRAAAILETLVAEDPRNTAWRQHLAAVHDGLGDVAADTGDLAAARERFEMSLAVKDALARQDPRNAGWQHALAATHDRLGQLALAAGDLAAAREHYEKAREILEALLALDPRNADWRRSLAASHDRLGQLADAEGDLPALREHTAQALAIAEALVAQDPDNSEWRFDLAGAHANLGLAARRAGDLAAARTSYEQALAAAADLAARDPGNATWRHRVTRLLQQLGEVAREAGDLGSAREHAARALADLEALAAHDPANGEWRHDLGETHRDLGDIAAGMGDLAAADDRYRASVEIMEALVRQDPGNADWRWDLANGHDRRGDVALATGDRAAARDHYEEYLAAVEALVAQDPGNARWQTDLARSHQKLGDLDLEARDRDAARRHYGKMIEISQALATRDPGNATWQRTLAVGHERLGDLEGGAEAPDAARAHHEQAFAIREALAARNPANVLWQDDLAVSHARLGNLALDAGDFDRAREHHERALAINATLAARDPHNADWQRGLAVSHDGLGNVARARGDHAAARGHYEKVVEVIEDLAAREPRAIRWQRDLITGHAKLGDLARKAGELAAARGHLEKQLAIQEALAAGDPQNGQLVVDVAVTRLLLESLDTHDADREDAARATEDPDAAGEAARERSAADETRAGPDGT